jgi:hypothetical protein
MAPKKSKVDMPGVASGKELAGIPVGDETAEERVNALLGGSVAEDSYKVSNSFYLKFEPCSSSQDGQSSAVANAQE